MEPGRPHLVPSGSCFCHGHLGGGVNTCDSPSLHPCHVRRWAAMAARTSTFPVSLFFVTQALWFVVGECGKESSGPLGGGELCLFKSRPDWISADEAWLHYFILSVWKRAFSHRDPPLRGLGPWLCCCPLLSVSIQTWVEVWKYNPIGVSVEWVCWRDGGGCFPGLGSFELAWSSFLEKPSLLGSFLTGSSDDPSLQRSVSVATGLNRVKKQKVKTIFPHTAGANQTLLSFAQGDVITLLISEEKDGWLYGEHEDTKV